MNRWNRLRQTFWFVPTVMCLAAVVLAEGLILLDRRLGDSDLGSLGPLLTEVGESGSRDLLGAVAGSMLTVASTTFSITIAVLALSSSTYGPRLVRNFMADRGNQVVLGVFVATFLYSLVVLRSIRVVGDGPGDYFVPHLAVNVAVLLGVLAIGVLVYFIHHISDSIQVGTLARRVRVDLLAVVDRLHPASPDRRDPAAEAGPDAGRPPEPGAPVTSDRTGYVQTVDLDRLVDLAARHDVVLSLQVRPGAHVTPGTALLHVSPPGPLGDEVVEAARGAVRVGRARDPREDVEFPALLLEEMAVRALSPGTNDPYTAINALDDLASGLVVLAGRPVRSPCRYDGEGRLRVVTRPATLLDVVGHLADAMRFYAVAHPPVLHRFLDLLLQVGAEASDDDVRAALARHAWRLVDAYAATSPQEHDLRALTAHAALLGTDRTGP